MSYFVYILYSDTIDRYYVGKTDNPADRLVFHNSEGNKIWTKRGQPWVSKRVITFANSTLASKAENFIKKQKSRVFIEKIIREGWKGKTD